MTEIMAESGPVWLDRPDGYRPGWAKISEDGSRWVMTEMTDPDDIAFWFPDPPPPHRAD